MVLPLPGVSLRPPPRSHTLQRPPARGYAPPSPRPAPRPAPLSPQYTHLRWSKEWMLREDLPWPPPTQLRERPNMSAAPTRCPPHGLMPERPNGRAPAVAAQAEEAAAEVAEGPPTTFLPGAQLRTDIQPEPAVRPPRFTAAAARNAGKCSSPARPPPTGLCGRTTEPGVHRATAGLRPRRRGGAREEGGEPAVSDGGRERETCARSPEEGIGEDGCLKVTAMFTIFSLYDKNKNSYCMAYNMCHRPEHLTYTAI